MTMGQAELEAVRAELEAVRAVLWDYWLGMHMERCWAEWPHPGCPYPPPPEAAARERDRCAG